MRMCLALSLVCGMTYGSALASGDPRLSVAKECGLAEDYLCVIENLLEALGEETTAMINDEGQLMLTGARLEFALLNAAPSVPSEIVRSSALEALSLLEQKHPDTSLLYAGFHIALAEACDALRDATCVKRSAEYLCENGSRLSAPRARDSDAIGVRINAVMSRAC